MVRLGYADRAGESDSQVISSRRYVWWYLGKVNLNSLKKSLETEEGKEDN